jgi:hypothetical protein
MFLLSLIWLLIGGGVGLLAAVAWRSHARLHLAALGAGVALGAGWLGVASLGIFFATGLALWVSILLVILLPPGLRRLRKQKE